jgi:NADPH:quinone reductase-like Zn-dependent oxidoreductase
MRAAVLHAFGEVPCWEEIPPPVPQDGEELIEVTAAPVNNIDRVRADGSHYSVRSGEYAAGGLPAVPGVIGAGRRPGGQRVLSGSRCGTMAQYSVASPQMTFPIPDGLDDAMAAAAWNPRLSAWLAFGWRCPLQPGQTVLILGATGVTGKLAVQAARHYGAGRIVAAGRNQQTLDTLPELGADATIQLGEPDDALAAAFAARAGKAATTWWSTTYGDIQPRCTSPQPSTTTRRSGPGVSGCSRPARWPARSSRCPSPPCAARAWRSSAWAPEPCRRRT